MNGFDEFLEEAYDSIDEAGYRDYDEDNEYDGFIIEDEDNSSPFDDENILIKDEEEPCGEDYLVDEEEPLSSWSVYGLDKSYEGEFEISHAVELFGEYDIDYQLEAIRYATFYAKNRNVEAQNFIVMIIQMKSSVDAKVHELALTAFTLFFRNYVRVQCQKYYSRMEFPNDYERLLRTSEAVEECFVMILEDIYDYDSNKGRLSTFFSNRILGSIATFEAKRRGRASKQTMGIDKKVSKIETELISRGIKPTARRIALEMEDKNVERIFNSVARLEAENTMLSIEADQSKMGICNKVEQARFDKPEEAYLKGETSSELMAVISTLSNLERDILLRMNNMILRNGTIIDAPENEVGDIYAIARDLDMKSGEVKRIYTNVVMRIKNEYNVHNGNDKLLEGRSMIFASREKDDEVNSFLNDIVEIF